VHVMCNEWTMSEKRPSFAHISSCSIVGTGYAVHTTPQNSKFPLFITVAYYIVVFVWTYDSDKSVVGHRVVLVRFGTAVGHLA